MRISDWSSDVCSSDLANAAALVETGLPPPALLTRLKAIEADFGKRAGQRWGARTLDLDIVLWSGAAWSDRGIHIPNPHFRDGNSVFATQRRTATRRCDQGTEWPILWQSRREGKECSSNRKSSGHR